MGTGILWVDWTIAIVFLVLWLGSSRFSDWYVARVDRLRKQVVEYQLDENLTVTFTGNWSKRQIRKKMKEIREEAEKIRAA